LFLMEMFRFHAFFVLTYTQREIGFKQTLSQYLRSVFSPLLNNLYACAKYYNWFHRC
jgi:hypothetical protein